MPLRCSDSINIEQSAPIEAQISIADHVSTSLRIIHPAACRTSPHIILKRFYQPGLVSFINFENPASPSKSLLITVKTAPPKRRDYPPSLSNMVPPQPIVDQASVMQSQATAPIKVDGTADVEQFFHLATSQNRSKIKSINLYLNADKYDDYQDDLLAMAFTQFHPDHKNINPHKIERMAITVHGMILFTRQTYVLTSPAASADVNARLRALLTNRTSRRDKEELPFGIIAHEKAIVPALLGLRGIKKVEINGNMDGELLDELLVNMTTRPGAVAPASPPRGGLDVPGAFFSGAYEDFLDRNPVGYGNPYAKNTFDKKSTLTSLRASTGSRRDRRSLSNSNNNSNVSDDTPVYRIDTLKRIAATPQDLDDFGPGKKVVRQMHLDYMNGEGRKSPPKERWVVPTGKGARCVMGWKAVSE